MVEADEQQAAGQHGRLHRADHRRLVAEAPQPAVPRQRGDDQRGGDAEAEEAVGRAHAEQRFGFSV